ncbi:glycine oxidase maturase GoxB [Roseibium sediminicola]|uniref:Glycine oxidase maturase GoxB n=1 Tax=Roseibium sediminicola TaxID=2933272 RepID=A0ABT0GS42_9HYPH|nr:glycine oxidase maturase GoxB [Roseibium sp. CAU 1639]MCK7612259.1 glycine oxidase maturase GoxB [Roseibium sp. CAU 1639]
MERSRVIVVGGGLSAMAACLTLADAGVPALWIAPEARVKTKPGESLASAAIPLLERLGLESLLKAPGHRKVEVLFSSWGTNNLVERNRAGLAHEMGYVIDRAEFEVRFSEEVNTRPEIDCCSGAVVSAERHENHWRVRTDNGLDLEADFLIDGTGRQSVVGRQYATLHRQDKLAAAYDFLVQGDDDVEPTPATLVEAVPGGWWYATLLQDGRLALNYYSDPDLMPKGLGHDVEAWKTLIGNSRYVSRWIETGGFLIGDPPSVTSAGTTFLSTPAGPGWIAVGDAAAAFDPLSSHGMTSALWTGIEGAEAAARSLSGLPGALIRYQERVAGGISRYTSDRAQIYRGERRFPDCVFWKRRHAIAA